jgi:hypothetical protein
MWARTFLRNSIGVVLTLWLVVILSFAAWAGSARQPLTVKKPPVLETCPEIFDPELETLCGRYDTYYFGLDVIINLTGSGPFFTLTPHPHMPPGTIVTPTGIRYQDAEVTFMAGVRRHSLYQAVQVTGDRKIVTGVVNLDIMVPRDLVTRQPLLSLPKASLIGLTH